MCIRLATFKLGEKPITIGLLKQFKVLPLEDISKAVIWFNQVNGVEAARINKKTLEELHVPRIISDFLLWRASNLLRFKQGNAFQKWLVQEGIGRDFNVVVEIPNKDVETLVRSYGNPEVVCLG